jgi:hypothetical protein
VQAPGERAATLPGCFAARTGDYSAFIRLGRGPQGLLYCEADSQFRPTPQVVADGVEHARQFRPDGFAVEINQYQELLCTEYACVGQPRQFDDGRSACHRRHV